MPGNRLKTMTCLLLKTDQRQSASAQTEATRDISYLPFGYCAWIADQSMRSGFNGQARDKHTHRYWLGEGYRELNTTLMRFQSPDSLSPFEKGGINAYAYCAADPVNFVDPTGHAPYHVLKKIRTQNALKNALAEIPPQVPPRLQRAGKKLTDLQTAFARAHRKGGVRGKYTSYASPSSRTPGAIPTRKQFDEMQKAFSFAPDGLPSTRSYAVATSEGGAILETVHFEASKRYYRSLSSNKNLTAQERQSALIKTQAARTREMQYILEHAAKAPAEFDFLKHGNTVIRQTRA